MYKMGLFTKIVNGFQSLTISVKGSILDICLGSRFWRRLWHSTYQIPRTAYSNTIKFWSFIHSVHGGINPPPPLKNTTSLFLAKPLLKSANCPSPSLFRQSPPLSWFFVDFPLPLKVGFFIEPQDIKVFHP